MPDAPSPSSSLLAAALRHRLTWPLVTLALLLAVNTAFNASFLHVEWRDGHFYGSLVDILNRAAPPVAAIFCLLGYIVKINRI